MREFIDLFNFVKEKLGFCVHNFGKWEDWGDYKNRVCRKCGLTQSRRK